MRSLWLSLPPSPSSLLHSPWQLMAFVYMPETVWLLWISRARVLLGQSGASIQLLYIFYILSIFCIPTTLTSLLPLPFPNGRTVTVTIVPSPLKDCGERWPANCYPVLLKCSLENTLRIQRLFGGGDGKSFISSALSYIEPQPQFFPCVARFSPFLFVTPS